jgi:hypothetical protein
VREGILGVFGRAEPGLLTGLDQGEHRLLGDQGDVIIAKALWRRSLSAPMATHLFLKSM